VSWCVIVVRHPVVCNVRSDTLDPFWKSFQDVFVAGVINCLCWRYKVSVHSATAVEKKNHCVDPGFAHTCFLRTRRTFRVLLWGQCLLYLVAHTHTHTHTHTHIHALQPEGRHTHTHICALHPEGRNTHTHMCSTSLREAYTNTLMCSSS